MEFFLLCAAVGWRDSICASTGIPLLDKFCQQVHRAGATEILSWMLFDYEP